jgi:hypothetical protein
VTRTLRLTEEQLAALQLARARKRAQRVLGPAPSKRAAALTKALAPKSKYGNVPTAGYASKREAARAAELKALAASGAISHLREQVAFTLIPAQRDRHGRCLERALTYIADFVYTLPTGAQVVEDTKGHRTPDYVIKRKLMLLLHGIRVREV